MTVGRSCAARIIDLTPAGARAWFFGPRARQARTAVL